MKALENDALVEAASANLVTHVSWVQQQTGGMRVFADEELVLADSGLPGDTFNIVCRARLAPERALSRLRQVVGYFAHAGRSFSWWLGPGDEPPQLGRHLLEAGLDAVETEVAMAASLAALGTAELAPGGLQIRRVQTPEQLQAFGQLVVASSTTPDPGALRFYELAAPALLSAGSPLRLYLGYIGQVPVATAELAVGGGVVGLYNISSLEAFRRRGIGTALTLWPLLEAREAGHHTAVLQASAEGVGIYRRIGFQSFGRYTEYKPPEGAGGKVL